MLNKAEYATWKVKMMMFLEATDCDYLERIQDGPFVPKKLIHFCFGDGVDQPEYYGAKDKS